MQDTSIAAERRYYELLRQQTPQQRLHTAMQLSAMVRQLAVADIRRRNPQATEAEIREELARRLYGEEAARLFASKSAHG